MAFLRLLGGISPILLSEKMSRETLVVQQSESGRLLSLLRLFRILDCMGFASRAVFLF